MKRATGVVFCELADVAALGAFLRMVVFIVVGASSSRLWGAHRRG